MNRAKLLAYIRLMRVDRPIGTLLLLWPALWALWLAAGGVPAWHLILVFVLGVFLMRAAGCVINDYADRHFDGYVKRTKNRPFPSGEVTERGGKLLFIILVLLSFFLVLTLNNLTIALSVVGLLLALIYPFMKRITHLPQLILGMAFSWSIPMVYAAVSNQLPLNCWLLLLANLLWIVAYDTQYAMVDRDDDLKIGIKSTAILFGRFDKIIIAFLQLATLLLLVAIALLNRLNPLFYISLLLVAGLFVYQQWLMADRSREGCFRAFMNNNYVGLILFVAIVLSV